MLPDPALRRLGRRPACRTGSTSLPPPRAEPAGAARAACSDPPCCACRSTPASTASPNSGSSRRSSWGGWHSSSRGLRRRVLQGRRDRFTAGALGSALVTLLLLNAVGPDEVIVRMNAWRAGKGRPFDADVSREPRCRRRAGGARRPSMPFPPPSAATGPACCSSDGATAASGREDVWTIERWRATGPLLGRLAIEAKTACRGIRIWT